ncbi:MAG: hypothetical protein ACO3ND_09295 [Opitutales bacterium]
MSQVAVTDDQMTHLVAALGDFAYGMLKNFVRFQDDMSDEARLAFDRQVRVFNARVGEFFPIEDVVAEILAAREEDSTDEAA